MKNRTVGSAGARWLWLGLLVGMCVVACKKVKPQPPAATAFDDTLAIGPSYLSAPVLFEVNELEDKINRSLGSVLIDRTHSTDLRLRVVRSGRVRVAFDGTRLRFGAPLSIWIDNPLDWTQRRTLLGSLDVEFGTPLAIGPDWRLRTRVQLRRYRWTRAPRVRFLGVRVEVKKRVDKLLKNRRSDIERAIDRAIHQELRLDREIAAIWRDIHQPLRINKNYENVWLVPHPYAVETSPVYGNRQVIVVPLRVRLRLETRLGNRPDRLRPRPLPRLRRVPALPLTTELNLLSRIPYDRLNQTLARTLRGKTLALPTEPLHILGARVYGGGHTVVLETRVAGAMRGTLYFRGRPAFDSLRQTVAIQHFEYDVHTEEVLPHTADYLLHDVLKDTLQAALSLPLRRHLAELPARIETAFGRGRAGRRSTLDIQTFRLTPRRVSVRPEAIHVYVNVRTSFQIAVTNL